MFLGHMHAKTSFYLVNFTVSYCHLPLHLHHNHRSATKTSISLSRCHLALASVNNLDTCGNIGLSRDYLVKKRMLNPSLVKFKGKDKNSAHLP